MKKSLVALSVLAVLSAASVAQAGIPETLYVGVNGGVTRQASQNTPVHLVGDDNLGFSGGLYVGYNINQYFGVEAGYNYFSEFEYTDGKKKHNVDTHGPEISGRLSLPLSDDGSDLFLRGGAMYAFSSMKGAESSDKVIPVVGFGIQVQLTDHISTRVGYDRYIDVYSDHNGTIDENVGYDIEKVYVALNYNFSNKAPEPVVEPVTKTITQTFNLDANTTFGFDSAELTEAGKDAVNSVVVQAKQNNLQFVKYNVSGYSDPIGSDSYNQKLSQQRANAVANELVNRGVSTGDITATGFGSSTAVTGTACDNVPRGERIKCLAPERRVEIEVTGTTTETVTE